MFHNRHTGFLPGVDTAFENGWVTPKPPDRLTGKTVRNTFLGEASEHVLQIGEQKIKVVAAPPISNVPAELTVEFDPSDVVVLAE